MSEQKKFTDKTAADSKSIGFDYQYYFFLWKLLALKTGESVGLEVMDDVHTSLNNDAQILYQIKHSVKVSSEGKPVNLTEYDPDLWKTLSNWVKVISDSADGRSETSEQIKFIQKTDFVLASNKSDSGTKIQNLIINIQKGNTSYADAISTLSKLHENTDNTSLKKHIDDVLKLSESVLIGFMKKIHFELGQDEILSKCRDEIKADKVPENKIESVFRGVDSAIREDNFITIKSGGKIVITFDDFYTKYRRHYDLARNDKLPMYEFTGGMPEELDRQVFIMQLIEVGDLVSDDLETLIELTRHRLKMQNNINLWTQEGELTIDEIRRLESDAKLRWRNIFKKNFRGEVGETKYNTLGLNVLDEVRAVNLSVGDQKLDLDMSNGEFYELSNTPEIGWRLDWEKYKK